ncbi:oxidoreductase [Phycicoccus endophyticus]|uniref:Oxidoreductase n=1 Tax=Phycicoccus endophyticus TaxID=1690220 RepID=A0A7G9QY99_9MICO|nr:NAD-dependent epimerase/dehydratase family protein [Phycicoccus endophyticus]NHI19215.1 oxidoreductase [Phycicoccus endophyticus]QNN48324.1 oxidoreductase [Phycicoccus endophyticus]GGL41030.1 reductase [Phycicoccus endophyticus]
MRLLLLGGTAFLGRAVARVALEDGHDVTCVARGVSGGVAPGARLVRHDRDHEGLGGVEDEHWDAVVDLARDPGQVRRAVTALAGRAAHWVFVSTVNVYADHSRAGADESTPLLAAREDDDGPDAYGAGKVACEGYVLEAAGPQHALVARPGLIGGPGDGSGRTGYWPWRFAHPAGDGEVLVPDALQGATQVLDVRDLAAWLVTAAEQRIAGVADAVGPRTTLGAALAAAAAAARSHAVWTAADPGWLTEHGVDAWMGPRSLPLWLPFPDHAGFADRGGAAARALGLTTRALEDTLVDTLAWEERRPADRPRRAGLTDDEERELLAAWHARG